MTPVPAWLAAEFWRPAFPPLTSGTARREAALTSAIIEQFRVEDAKRYQPDEFGTRCNLFLSDVTRALGCHVPELWKVGPTYNEQRANHQIDWLKSKHAELAGWHPVANDAAALERVNLGHVVVVGWHSGSDSPGHVAIGKPSAGARVLHVAQAGRSCFTDGPVSQGFGLLPVRFWTHD